MRERLRKLPWATIGSWFRIILILGLWALIFINILTNHYDRAAFDAALLIILRLGDISERSMIIHIQQPTRAPALREHKEN